METTDPAPSRGKRLLLLGDARQAHITRWADHFQKQGYAVVTVSLQSCVECAGTVLTPPVPALLPDCIRYPLAVPSVRKAINRFNPDLINAHFVPNYGLIAALIDRAPWVLSTWGSDIMLLPEKSPFHLWRTRYVLRRARFITSDAEIMSEKLVRLGCDTDSILTVPYGVDLNRFHPPADRPERTGPRLLSNRKLEPVYNIETIIDSMTHLTGRLPDMRLLIVGNGSLKRSLLERAKVSTASRSITFLSEVAHTKVADLLRDQDIYLSMSRSDTTSVSLLEAMACGVFPIVSDIPANHEWIEEGVNGLLVPVDEPGALADAIERAWNDRTFRRSAAAANARIIAERADWQQNMAEVERLFERAIRAHA